MRKMITFAASIMIAAHAAAQDGCVRSEPSPVFPKAASAIHSFIPKSPNEAIETLRKIRNGERLPYRRDGVVFENRERLLPQKPRGYYREYTVPTPGAKTRGARRIVTGGEPPEVWYYTDDHYDSFRRIEVYP